MMFQAAQGLVFVLHGVITTSSFVECVYLLCATYVCSVVFANHLLLTMNKPTICTLFPAVASHLFMAGYS